MLLNNFAKFTILSLVLVAGFANNSKAQSPICNLQFAVFEFDAQKIEGKTLENIDADLTDLTTKRVSKSSAFTKTPFFSGLVSGRYAIEIIKDGYQRRVKEFELNCNSLDETKTISRVVYLQKGNSNEISKFGSTILGVKNNENELDKSNVGGKALILPKPIYPADAKTSRLVGAVKVEILIDEDGEVITASAVSGHSALRQAAEAAAKESRFEPTFLKGQPVKVMGVVTYNFKP